LHQLIARPFGRGAARLAVKQELKMTVPNGVWGHNAVFEKAIDHNGTTYWKVFEQVDGLEKRKVLIGEIHINTDGYESPLLFAAARSLESFDLQPQAEQFLGGHIESRFIFQLADFMRETEKRLIKLYPEGGIYAERLE
jgi:hypothetical protein